MHARRNPSPEQLRRRLRRPPESERDPRYEKDGYWALLLEGHSHRDARRAFRDEPPKIREQVVVDSGECDPEELLFQPGSTYRTKEVAKRPLLTEEAIIEAKPRRSEYSIWDHDVIGFGLRVRASGFKSFILKCEDRNGEQRKFTLGRPGSMTLDVARREARKLKTRIVGRSDHE